LPSRKGVDILTIIPLEAHCWPLRKCGQRSREIKIKELVIAALEMYLAAEGGGNGI